MVNKRKPKRYDEWVSRLIRKKDVFEDEEALPHYQMEYNAAFGFSGTQIMEFIEYMKSSNKAASVLIGSDFVYGLLDRVTALESRR